MKRDTTAIISRFLANKQIKHAKAKGDQTGEKRGKATEEGAMKIVEAENHQVIPWTGDRKVIGLYPGNRCEEEKGVGVSK